MFENKPLSKQERAKLNPYYLEVIKHYEYITNQSFMRDDLVLLKLLVEVTTPAVIKKQISVFYKKYPENFNEFSYIYKPTRNMFKNKKRSNKQ